MKLAMTGGMASIADEYIEVLNSSYSNLNVSGERLAMFYGNTAGGEGGALKSYYSDITIDDSVRFEKNRAIFGGGIHLGDNSRLLLSSSTQCDISFVLNHAHRLGGCYIH